MSWYGDMRVDYIKIDVNQHGVEIRVDYVEVNVNQYEVEIYELIKINLQKDSMAPNIQPKRKVPEGEGDAEKLARVSSTKQSSRKNNERFSTHSLLKVGYNTLNTKCTDFSSTAKHKAPKSSTFDTLWVASKLKFLVITSPPKSITLILAHLHLPAQLPKRMMIPVFQFTCPSLFSICLKLSMPMKNFLSYFYGLCRGRHKPTWNGDMRNGYIKVNVDQREMEMRDGYVDLRGVEICETIMLSEMGIKQKKAFKKNLKKANSKSLVSANKNDAADFLPLEGGPGRKLPQEKPLVNKATVLYIGRIPHGFYEKEMQAFFSQFGVIKRLRIARNKKTGKSKHFGFIEFQDPEVAEVVADTMQGYLLFEHLLQVHLILPENVHPKLWKGFNPRFKPVDFVQEERKRQNKERTLMEHKKLVDKILKRDQKRRKRIEAAGIEYECPEIVGGVIPTPKRIKFDED
ncbi:hypothetical protein LWI29_002058 [Acer saccharum]|uniref:RRM domain-containing protein n=1 Tax=Acer saccharum TaxID=4024 RepID=A0AA39SLW3_ACESA|nr:hypothetical protein LWI29_002058 [Acer saccharum]